MQIIRFAPDGPEVERSAEVIAREHAANKDLAHLCEQFRQKPKRSAPNLLRAIVAVNTNADVLAQASYSLASLLKRQIAEASPGPELDRAAQEAEKMYELVISKFADQTIDGAVLGEKAESDLF